MNLAEGYLKTKQIHKNQADWGLWDWQDICLRTGKRILGLGGGRLVELLRSQNKAAGDKTVSWELFSEQLWSVCSHRK